MARFLVDWRRVGAWVIGILVVLAARGLCWGDAVATSRPADQIKTGEVELTFTERSPLSDRKELARRLNLKEGGMGDDYDLSKCPFKAYVPTNYDAGTPCGVIVYLGYKNTASSPPLWQPVLEKEHLIFISPVCHSGANYAPSVPLWQTMGLALDAVYNLKRQYSIDESRVYQMSWNGGSTQMAFATADVFTGFIVTEDAGYCGTLRLPNGRYYPPSFAPPPAELFRRAKDRAFFMIGDDSDEQSKLKTTTMKREGFAGVMLVPLSLSEDLHFPNFKAEWFEVKALPLLDRVAASEAKASPPAGATTRSSEAAAPPAPSEAQHLLTLGQLYISNGQPEMARTKLQMILDDYPNDPAAAKAKELLQQIGH